MGNGLLVNIRRAAPTEEDVNAIRSVMLDAFEKYKLTNLEGSMEVLKRRMKTYTTILSTSMPISAVDGVPVGSIRVDINKEKRTAYIRGLCLQRVPEYWYRQVFMNLVDKLLMSKE